MCLQIGFCAPVRELRRRVELLTFEKTDDEIFLDKTRDYLKRFLTLAGTV